MRRMIAALVAVMVVTSGAAFAAEPAEVVRLLVFTETTGFRHASINDGVTAFRRLAEADDLADVDFTVEVTNTSSGHFTDANLGRFDVVVFLSNTGNPLDVPEQEAFERFIRAGGGYVGIHAAADNEYTWPWYGDLVGGYFKSHPNGTPKATIDVEDPDQASTAHLPARWTRVDEWYNYRRNPRSYVCNTEPEAAGVELQTIVDFQPPTQLDPREKRCGVHVLLNLDETTYANNADAMGDDHPIAWCHDYDGGRSFYTGLGHTSQSFVEPEFVQHVIGGVLTAAGLADCKTPTS